jgi:heterodisulfide reductase subunit C
MLSTMAVELIHPHYLVAMQAVISLMMRLKHGASHTPPFNIEVKNCWKCTACTALCMDGWKLDQFSVLM